MQNRFKQKFSIIFIILLLTNCSRTEKPWETITETGEESVVKFTETEFKKFGTVTIEPEIILDGKGENIDQIAIWEASDPENMMIFVTGKNNAIVEVWKYPFKDNEQEPLHLTTAINGIALDQEANELYVAEFATWKDKFTSCIKVFSIPDLKLVREVGKGKIGFGETSLDILKNKNGETWIYITDNFFINYFHKNGEWLGKFRPNIESFMEELLVDNYHQIIYVPDQAGGEMVGAQGIYAFKPDGSFYTQKGTNRFGNGYFTEDAEGIALYKILKDGKDTGRGFIIISDQKHEYTKNEYEFFDRKTWTYLGTLKIKGVNHTDGIESSSKPLSGFPKGIFAAVDEDEKTVIVGWHTILKATGLI